MLLTIEQLDVRHPSYDEDFWLDLEALYRGGRVFRDRIERFLPRNPLETADVYEQRKQNASYRSYVGPIIDYYSSWLFSGDFHVRAKRGPDTIDTPPEYAEFREDIGGDCDMKEFLKERFTKALIHGRTHWICELSKAKEIGEQGNWPDSAAAYEAAGLKNANLRAVDACELVDWETDDDGLLAWALVYRKSERRPSIKSVNRIINETWHLYDRENCFVYSIEYDKDERPDEKTVLTPQIYKHGFLQVPLITLALPQGLHIADRVTDPQCAHFRLGSALDWAIKRTCYAMPVFKVEDEERPPVMGAGYYIMIGAKEDMQWSAPPEGHFDVISREVDVQRNDIFRMCHQMALGLDNNAETVGRSADSKEQDNAATRVMLNAFGEIMSEAIEETYEIVSDAFGDVDIYWSIEGFSGYDTATAPEVIANAQQAQLVAIPSKTFAVEMKNKVVKAVLPELSQERKDQIRKELESNVDIAGDMQDIMQGGYINIQQRTSVNDAAESKSAQGATSAPAR